MQNDEFAEILIAGSHLNSINFWCCKIESDNEWDFSAMKSCKIEHFYLFSSGQDECSNWKFYPNRFLNIIKGIKNCAPLKKTLKLLQVSNSSIITIKCWKLKWRGVWEGSWSLFYLLISLLVYRGRKFIPWIWNWLQQSSSFMGRAISTTASTAIVFIFIINSVLIKSYSISLFNIECYLYIKN